MLNRFAIAVAALSACALASPAFAQACPKPPERLTGTLNQTFAIDSGMLTQSYETTATVVWVQEVDELQPLPTSRPAQDGMIGSAAWQDFHKDTPKDCPVVSYRIDSGQIKLKLKSRSGAIGGPGSCEGTAESTFNADALKKFSALYLGPKGYLMTMAAPDCTMPQSTIKGTCKTPGRNTPWESPVNDNAIMVLDRRGESATEIKGQMSEPRQMGWKLTANWQFAAQ